MATIMDRSRTAAACDGDPARGLSPKERELRDLLAERTLKRGEFRLSSGRRSRIYFNMKATMMHPRGASLCGQLLLQRARSLRPDYIGGLEMGAVPLLGTVAAYSCDNEQPIPAIFVRKQPKAHGTALMIEGLDDDGGESLSGKTILLIDDVATTGGSVLKAIDQIHAAGGMVKDALVILDREEGAAGLLSSRGVKLHSLLTASDLGISDEDRIPLV